MIARWRGSEPVRLCVYPALLALVVYLVSRGYVDGEIGNAIAEALGALLIGIPAAEYARKQVTPPDHMRSVIADGTDAALDLVDAELTRRLGSGAAYGREVLEQVRERVADLRGARHLPERGE